MNLDLLQPFAHAHAVQSVALGAEWQGELSDQTLLRIRALHEQFAHSLPKVDLQKSMQIQLSPTEGFSAQSSASLGGVVFQSTTELGAVRRQFIVNRTSCTLVLNDYSRWAPTLEFAMMLFNAVIPIILADKPITYIGLQYTDLFTWKDDPALLDLRKVLNTASPFIPPGVFDLGNAWHSHHGYIAPGGHEAESERLNNININVWDVAGERTLQIMTSHRATLSKPLRRSTENYLAVVESLQNRLHNDGKATLKGVLSEAVAEKIQLK